jgi:hypothetical protein
MHDISISDWVLILTTLFLGATAVLTPAVGGSIKRWWLQPVLPIDYVQASRAGWDDPPRLPPDRRAKP